MDGSLQKPRDLPCSHGGQDNEDGDDNDDHTSDIDPNNNDDNEEEEDNESVSDALLGPRPTIVAGCAYDQEGLISPCKRLRVVDDDVAQVPAVAKKSFCGKEEAYHSSCSRSLLESLDGSDFSSTNDRKNTTVMNEEIRGVSFGGRNLLHPLDGSERGTSRPITEKEHIPISSQEASCGMKSRFIFNKNCEITDGSYQDHDHEQINDDIRACRSLHHSPSTDEISCKDNSISPVELRQFPGPPCLNGAERSRSPTKFKHPSLSTPPDDSLLFASYHPDFQTLDSRVISFPSPPGGNAEEEDEEGEGNGESDNLVTQQMEPLMPSKKIVSLRVDSYANQEIGTSPLGLSTFSSSGILRPDISDGMATAMTTTPEVDTLMSQGASCSFPLPHSPMESRTDDGAVHGSLESPGLSAVPNMSRPNPQGLFVNASSNSDYVEMRSPYSVNKSRLEAIAQRSSRPAVEMKASGLSAATKGGNYADSRVFAVSGVESASKALSDERSTSAIYDTLDFGDDDDDDDDKKMLVAATVKTVCAGVSTDDLLHIASSPSSTGGSYANLVDVTGDGSMRHQTQNRSPQTRRPQTTNAGTLAMSSPRIDHPHQPHSGMTALSIDVRSPPLPPPPPPPLSSSSQTPSRGDVPPPFTNLLPHTSTQNLMAESLPPPLHHQHHQQHQHFDPHHHHHHHQQQQHQFPPDSDLNSPNARSHPTMHSAHHQTFLHHYSDDADRLTTPIGRRESPGGASQTGTESMAMDFPEPGSNGIDDCSIPLATGAESYGIRTTGTEVFRIPPTVDAPRIDDNYTSGQYEALRRVQSRNDDNDDDDVDDDYYGNDRVYLRHRSSKSSVTSRDDGRASLLSWDRSTATSSSQDNNYGGAGVGVGAGAGGGRHYSGSSRIRVRDSHSHSSRGESVGDGEYELEDSYPSSLAVSDRKTRKALLQSSGYLKLAMYMNVGLLTVHVIRARNLSSSWSSLCDSYVKMSLVPDDSKRTRCKTPVICGTNCAVYDQKFSIEIMKEDRRKRLLISVWHKDTDMGASEFLGCMSFGVSHLLNKDVNGWYYMLTEEVGRKKHLKAHFNKNNNNNLLASKASSVSVPAINRVSEGQEKIVITVSRGKNGFGFSFVGELPPKVGRVDRASPAEQAGLKKGDSIIRVNGQNVSRSSCESVAHMVKKTNPTILSLELLRDHAAAVVEISGQPQSAKREAGTSTDHIYESILDGSGHHHRLLAGDRRREKSLNRTPPPRREVFLGGEEEQILTHGGMGQARGHAAITSTPRPTALMASNHSLNADLKKQEFVHCLMSLELDYIDFMRFGTERYSRPLRHCIISASQHSTMFQNVEKLVTISEYHIKQLQDSSSSVNSDTDDSQASDTNGGFPNSVALIYQSKIHMLCQAYESYAHGLTHSNALLREMRRNRDFINFIHEASPEPYPQPSISAFINRPVQYIHELYAVLRDIFCATPQSSPDFVPFQQVVCKMGQCISAITNLSSQGRVCSLDSLTSSQGCSTASSGKNSMASLTSLSSAETDALRPLVPPNFSAHLVDSQLASIQDRLIFPPEVATFQLCQEDRRVIFQGEIFRYHQGSWFKSQLLLLTDLILLLDQTPEGRLKVVENPMYLCDLTAIEVNRKHNSEFILYLVATPTYSHLPGKRGSSHSSSTKPLVLRAPSSQDKFLWKSLIEQHVSATGSSRLKHVGSMRDISNFKTSVVL